MRIAIITGASSGLGYEYVKEVIAQFPELDEYWLIARRLGRLELIRNEFPEKKLRLCPLDLTKEESYAEYAAMLREKDPTVKVLINNAGFGKLGRFTDIPMNEQLNMIDLNNRALTAITAITLPYMRRRSLILNVCSIAAFAPNPRMTVYSSTKAFVMSFSRALRFELKDRGINVTAVCPGPMKTEFLPVAGIEKGSSPAFDKLPYCHPDSVASNSLAKAKTGAAVYTDLGFYRFYRVLSKILPHELVMHFSQT